MTSPRPVSTPDPRWTDRVLSEAEARSALAAAAHLVRCSLDELDLRGAELTGCVLEDCSAVGARFDRSTADAITVRGGTWTDSRWEGADLCDATFEEVDLTNAVLDNALLTSATFRGCRLSGARLVETRGMGFTLTGGTAFATDLTGAHLADNAFEGTRLTEAVLRRATLRGATFDGCDLLGCDLEGAELTGADLRAAALPDDLPVEHLAGAVVTPGQLARLATAQWGVVVAEV